MDNRQIIIFDGVCNFCNAAVNFVIKRDPQGLFAFTPIQSELAQQLLNKYELDCKGIDKFALVKNDQCFVFSSAALEIAKDLSGYWYLFSVLKWVPRVIRDFFYKLFARYRYALFGKLDSCMVPTDAVRSRFVGL